MVFYNSMTWILGMLLILLSLAALVLLVKWFQRCPKCKSMTGPKGVRGWLIPDGRYKAARMCRKCGHTWSEEIKYDEIG